MSDSSTEQDNSSDPNVSGPAGDGAMHAESGGGMENDAGNNGILAAQAFPTVDDVLEAESAELVDDLGDGDVGEDSDGEDSDGEDSDGDDSGSDDSGSDEAPVTGEALLVQEGEIAGDYLEQLLDILDYDGDIDLDVEGSRAVVAIVGANDLDPLVGARGLTLDALQELTRLTVAQQTGVRTRLMLDVGGYRAGRRTELSDLATKSVSQVIESGEALRMTPMNAFERKIVHDVVTATDGVRSESEGEDPDRRVVILPDR